jgi:predicted phosphoribosyltransferase
MYRRGRPSISLAGRTVIVVDDGIATGATVRAGISALRQSGPAKIILAVPVAAMDVPELLRHDVDELVCLHSPPNFSAVGRFYVNFKQTTDKEVIALLDRSVA